jgi:hypothetical protein
MNSILRVLFIFLSIPFITNCSSHPEIVPYEAPSISREDNSRASAIANDSVFEDAIQSGKPFDLALDQPQMAETAAPLEMPVAPPPPPSPQPRRAASAPLTNGYYVFSRDCVMRTNPNAGSVGAGHVVAGKKLWLDVYDGQWLKAYKKSGTFYVPTSCIK